MCTVSVVAAGDRLRVMCNRDERHTRPDAHPPTVMRTRAGLALLPLDPLSGGSWIAASSAGLAFAVLNASDRAGTAGPSRGRLILDLIDATNLDDAIDRARRLCWRGWPAHRLLVVDAQHTVALRLSLDGLAVQTFGVAEPLMFTSSSLGDDLVEPLRRRVFEDLVLPAADRLDGQEAFHRHRWRDRPDLSVHMRRHDAATQSTTTIDLAPTRMSMRYESVREIAGTPAWLSIPATAASAHRVAREPAALALVS